MLSAGLLSFVLFPLECIFKCIVVFMLTLWVGFLIFVLAIWPFVILSFCWFVPAPLVVLGTLTQYHILMATLFFVFLITIRRFVRNEYALISVVGPKHALWCDTNTPWHGFGTGPVKWVVASFDLGDDRLLGQFQSKLLQTTVPNGSYSNYYELTSMLWSQFIVVLHTTLLPGPRVWLVVTLWSLNALLVLYLRPLKRMGTVIRYYALLVVAIITLNPSAVVFGIGVLYSILVFVVSLFSTEFVEWFSWVLTAVAVDVTSAFVEWNFISRKYMNRAGFRPTGHGSGFVPVFKNAVTKLAIVVSDLGLPHYILGGSSSYDAEHVQSTLDIMRDAGWPINVELDTPSRFASTSAYSSWLISGTTWKQGIHNRKMYVDSVLDPLRVKAVEWKRTEEYRTYDNEQASVARYFKSPRYNYPDLDVNDVWFLLGDIFRHSRITPMNYIIKMWEKKYALGSFMVDPQNPKKKYSRWKFISTIGYKNFKNLWRKTFEFAPLLAPVSHVSVKDEALPAKKFLADKVRTVVGSPIGQYIMSTVWNYSPNHNFRWVTTPIKVGMPLNGYWMNEVYSSHARCQLHFAGDMSEFDSTLSGNVLKLIAAVRKKGFEQHKDRERIATLIDINYDQVSRQLLNTTSTGDIYAKGTGLTTGHSSTSMDNSVGLVVLYLLAWKQLTGLSAKEFKFYNEISCFGDDHLLSMAGNKPASWNFRSIQSVMRRWGVTNNLEATGPLTKLSFLSKWARLPTPADLLDCKAAGVKAPKYAIVHDRDRLIGKMVSKVKSMDPLYRLKRLVSYMALTPHHPDVYHTLHNLVVRTATFRPFLKSDANPRGVSVPSYNKVVKDWYKPDATFPENMIDEVEETYGANGSIMAYGAITPLDSFLGAMALVPDFVNPSIFNFGYMATVQSKLHTLVSWPVQFLALANGTSSTAEVGYLLRKTVYEFLDPSICAHVDPSVNYTTLLVRHWIFLSLKSMVQWRATELPLTSFSRKVAQVQFSINGLMQYETKRFSLQILELALIALLGIIHVPDVLGWVSLVKLPDFNKLLEQLLYVAQATFWSTLPPNYSDTNKHLREIDGSKILTISAPTGSGKSTAFIKHVSQLLGHKYHKLIVVEPRSAIVKTIVPYVNIALSMGASGATTGLTLDQECSVWYVTAQELLLHPSWYSTDRGNNLIILDECHVSEPAYDLVKDIIIRDKVHSVWVSATPQFSQMPMDRVIDVPLTSARLYNVHTTNMHNDTVVSLSEFERSYKSEVLNTVHDRSRTSIMLVFCTTLAMCQDLAANCARPSFVLSSGTKDVPTTENGCVIFTTSVADVGITLPDVDFVMTSDIGFTVLQTLEEAKLAYYRLTNNELVQRSGRTGRTNNGACLIYRTPRARFVQDIQDIKAKTSVFDLLASGIPLEHILRARKPQLMALLGLNDVESDRAEATLQTSLDQLERYRSNLEPLLFERARLLDIGTNDGTMPGVIDTGRMGLFRSHSTVTSSDMIRSIINVAKHLGLRATANHEQAREHEEQVRNYSQFLIGNVKAKMPFPDPDLGEWGMEPEALDNDF